jgi:uncharacterized membrane protein YeaQ/YmgE (transglycosylase-associated protein family)
MNDFLSFLLLLGIAVMTRFIGNKLVPIIMPPSRLKTVFVGLVGGFIGSSLSKLCHFGDWAIVVGTNLLGAVIGTIVFVLLWGLFPFIKIFLGRV